MGLERAAWLERRYGAEIEWLPFNLHPEYPPEGIRRSGLEARYGEGFLEHVQGVIAGAGLAHDPVDFVPNSSLSLQLAELARDQGVFDRLHPLLFGSYWSKGRDIGDMAVLVELARMVGLEDAGVTAALEDGRYLERIEASTEAAQEAGASGVPAWLLDDGFLIPGAQPHDVFEQVLERLGFRPAGLHS